MGRSRSSSPSKRTRSRAQTVDLQVQPDKQGNKRQHQACKYCREHRIKCAPVPGDGRCKKCIDLKQSCDKSSAAPKDDRPRRRTLFKGAGKGGSSLLRAQGYEPRYLGSSSLAILVWKHVPQTSDIIDRLRGIDDRYDLHRGSIGGLEQNGLLIGQGESSAGKSEKPALITVSMVQAKLMQELGAETVLISLYETCRDKIIPLFPVISVSESLLADKANDAHVDKYAPVDPKSTPPTPLPLVVRMLHCAIASRSREVPESIQRSLQSSLHSLLLGPEMQRVASARCLGSIQVLVLLSMCEDLCAPDAADASENVWQNIGIAARMGFALGLHRNIATTHVPYFQLNRRLRVWGACVSMDRWTAIRMGRPFMVDPADCDAPLPRHYADGIRDGDLTSKTEPLFPCFRFMAEFTSLSLLLGRAHRLVASPSGLQSADDLSLLMLQSDIDNWLAKLPQSWPYSIKLVLRQAPLLMNLFIVVLEFTFQRVFLWPSTPIPYQVSFRPSRERWVNLCQRAEQAVYWLNSPDGAYYLDVWSITVYAAFCCVIIHLKVFEESKDPHHQWLLEMSNTIIQQWAYQQPNNQVRKRLASFSDLLMSIGTGANISGNTASSNTGSGISSSMNIPVQSGVPPQPIHQMNTDVHKEIDVQGLLNNPFSGPTSAHQFDGYTFNSDIGIDGSGNNINPMEMYNQLSLLDQMGLAEFGFGS
ncbi:uncharacterized protein I206_103027 [Kwoniella pini CBS 10737]|uniref:Zn(2)-C6 fungal-type domain-containing protein n=1 Tax=Kwoniella pini CBS 10737 TaxID=1296096 RepID=A0A1B9IAN3_9TREE|nr:uncharacterized protein I206_01968 [Kwoniella pini CBS 10737]OCF52675.1 hypothetical protein I206_01968 [Kwoniella pini CBS 10737]